jgi:hypothetical protein
MSTLELNGKDFATQTSSAEPVLASTVTGGAGLMPTGVTSLGTVTAGTLGSAVAFPAGMAVNFGYKTDSVRSTPAAGTEATFGTLTMSYNKLNASSILCVEGVVIGKSDADGHCGTGFKYGSSTAVWCGSYSYDGGNYMTLVAISGVLVGHTTTGAQTLKLIYGSDTASNLRPFPIMNPTDTDTTEFTSGIPNTSTMKVWEVLT